MVPAARQQLLKGNQNSFELQLELELEPDLEDVAVADATMAKTARIRGMTVIVKESVGGRNDKKTRGRKEKRS